MIDSTTAPPWSSEEAIRDLQLPSNPLSVVLAPRMSDVRTNLSKGRAVQPGPFGRRTG